MMTGGTFHREGIVSPRWRVYIFCRLIRFGFCKADCSCRLWFGIVARFQEVLLSANYVMLCGRWIVTVSVLPLWWEWQANIHRPCSLCPQGIYKQIPHGAEDPYGIKNQVCSLCFTSCFALLGGECLRLGGAGFSALPPFFLSEDFLGGVCCGSLLWLSV